MRISPKPPTKCTGCYSTKRHMPHVDFASKFDGPLIDPERPRAGHIEWLVLCQECVERAHALLPEQRDLYADLKARLAETQRQLDEERNYSSSMEDTLQRRPQHAGRKPAKPAARRAA